MYSCINEITSLQLRSTDYENCYGKVFFMEKVFGYPLRCSSPPEGTTAYQLLPRSINRQVAYRVAKNDVNLALSPTFRYVSIESAL
ncbi:hypothetical protein TNCV_1090671 [Trichonephila clavipes]|uniref:Uncharacterized protein n=1 Tax=Trichonephila clavipes TaxID=2585209 RepID=A0A8X6STA7_TRICX|nr:hypothetical protein TNCV_1090671 [Trichonephila clavipes]